MAERDYLGGAESFTPDWAGSSSLINWEELGDRYVTGQQSERQSNRLRGVQPGALCGQVGHDGLAKVWPGFLQQCRPGPFFTLAEPGMPAIGRRP